MIIINSILHFIVDGICAFAMFGRFGADGTTAYLFYNLCAFALQMPVGALADLVAVSISKGNEAGKRRFYRVVTLLGIVFVIIGMFAGPLALGVGNAMFHVGGGLDTIAEDKSRNLSGRALGVFVAPGALGLFVGKLASDFAGFQVYVRNTWIGLAALTVLAGFLRMYYEERHLVFVEKDADQDWPAGIKGKGSSVNAAEPLIIAIVCFIAVVIRSYVGLSADFSWKSGLVSSFMITMAVVLGKAAGGFISAWLGELRTVCISLGIAAVCFIFSDIPVFGILALFFFNMTMPITLYLLVKKMPRIPGFAFGLLTCALFAGFFMIYLKVSLPVSFGVLGCAGSIITLILLVIVILAFGKDKSDKGKR